MTLMITSSLRARNVLDAEGALELGSGGVALIPALPYLL